MCFRSLRHRGAAVVAILFCVMMLLVPSYLYRERYMSDVLGHGPENSGDPQSTGNTENGLLVDSSSQPKAPEAKIPLHNRFPSLQEQVHSGKSLVFMPSGTLPAFNDEVLDPIADRTFLLLKTGSETMWSRMPVHVTTTMKRFPHNAIYSDIAAPFMGHTVIDALMHLPASALSSPGLFGYRVRRQDVYEHWAWGPRKLNITGTGGGWELDKYKNVPAFADAWARSGDCDWYLMLDDDAYMLTPTFAALVRDKDPNEPWYFGKGVGAKPIFAHGGSGIVLSRGAMRLIFGEQTDYEHHANTIAMSAEFAAEDCCGDSVVAKVFSNCTGVPSERDLEVTEARETYEHGIFQGNTITTTRINYDKWCDPVGVFHHVAPWEIEELFAWERIVMARQIAQSGNSSAILYSEFYRDFILPHVVPDRLYWHFSSPTADFKAVEYTLENEQEVWDGDQRLHPVSVSSDCRRACELDYGCLTWHFQENLVCKLFLYDVGRGEALNPWSMNWESSMTQTSAGFMVDRIRAVRVDAQCDPLSKNELGKYNDDGTTSEGWYLRSLENARGPTEEWGIHDLSEEPITPP